MLFCSDKQRPQAFHLNIDHFAPFICQGVSFPFPVGWIGLGVSYTFDPALFKESPDRAVERACTEFDPSVTKFPDFLHDGISMLGRRG